MAQRDITLSVVSHGQNALVNQLLEDVQRFCADRVELILTENIPDSTPLATGALTCPVTRLVNDKVKGFGANHNAAFVHCHTPYFCVCNPDIRLPSDPFPALLETLADPKVAVASPLVLNPGGAIEDSVRRFPTAWALLKKLFIDRREPDYPTDCGALEVDWCAGMFILFLSDAYRAVSGFDERYFMYYEDIDLCERLRAVGTRVLYVPDVGVIHDARRGSHRNLMLMLHHLASLARFLARSSPGGKKFCALR